jgi:hypothetical protein
MNANAHASVGKSEDPVGRRKPVRRAAKQNAKMKEKKQEALLALFGKKCSSGLRWRIGETMRISQKRKEGT